MRDIDLSIRPDTAPWLTPESYWPGLGAATAGLETPIAALHLDALRHNAHQLRARAAPTPIRVATKSIRVRGVIEAILALPGFAGVLAYTLAESLWLADTVDVVDDVLVGYPTADTTGIDRLGRSPELAAKVTLVVDSLAQLDFVDSVLPPGSRETIRLCLELDSAWESAVFGRIGVRRSPVHTPEQARALAEQIVARPGFRLVGMMGYEAQVAELEFVNGGGTGSLESTHADAPVTDIAAGSGLFGGHRDRMPRPVWPEGLRYRALEMAGEVQTPEFAPVHDGQVVDMLPTYRGEGKAFL